MALFPSIDRIRDFISHKINSYDVNEVWKPLPFVLIREFLCRQMSYSTWYTKYVIANPDFFVLPGQTVRHNYTHYLYKSET